MTDPITKITAALKADHVIPDVIPESYGFSPTALFSIVWPYTGVEVVLGDKVPREKTLEEPHVKLLPLLSSSAGELDKSAVEEHSDVKYTLVMTDPDAPSRKDPKFGQWRHWVVTGIQLPAANAAETQGVFALKTKAATTPYYPPAPPAGSGYHRYVFLLFQEPEGGINIPASAVEHSGNEKARAKWNALEFAEKYKLKLIGANYFMTQIEK